MSDSTRPSRAQLQRRLRLLKRSVVVLAGAAFVALAGLAAGNATATGSDGAGPGGPHAAPQDSSQPAQPYFGYGPGAEGSGSTDALGGSGSPPVAGSHAS